jgi:hypothetical protein
MRQTSIDAYRSVADAYPAMQDKIFHVTRVSASYGLTLEQMAELSGIKLQSACGARLKLEKEGKIVSSGRKRPTKSGRQAMVWVAA